MVATKFLTHVRQAEVRVNFLKTVCEKQRFLDILSGPVLRDTARLSQ